MSPPNIFGAVAMAGISSQNKICKHTAIFMDLAISLTHEVNFILLYLLLVLEFCVAFQMKAHSKMVNYFK